jgi:hypothetical protein
MAQIMLGLATITDNINRAVRQLQMERGLEGLSLADTLVVLVVLVGVCCAISLSLRRVFQR